MLFRSAGFLFLVFDGCWLLTVGCRMLGCVGPIEEVTAAFAGPCGNQNSPHWIFLSVSFTLWQVPLFLFFVFVRRFCPSFLSPSLLPNPCTYLLHCQYPFIVLFARSPFLRGQSLFLVAISHLKGIYLLSGSWVLSF